MRGLALSGGGIKAAAHIGALKAFSEDYTEQKQEDTWMIVRKEKKTDKIKNFIKRMFHRA